MTSVLVLGMHRSGTSAVTRALNLLGLPLGREDDLIPPWHGNPRGFWESFTLFELNDEVLSRLGGTWEAPPRLARGWPSDPRLAGLHDRARTAIAEVYGKRSLWLWKDPRLCLTLPFWRQVLDTRQIVVVPYRNPLEVAASLQKRDCIPLATGLALWELYVRGALLASADLPCFVCSYQRLLDEPEHWCSDATKAFADTGIRLKPRSALPQVLQFVEPALRHERAPAPAETVATHVTPTQAALYELLVELDCRRFSPPPVDRLPRLSRTSQRLIDQHRAETSVDGR